MCHFLQSLVNHDAYLLYAYTERENVTYILIQNKVYTAVQQL